MEEESTVCNINMDANNCLGLAPKWHETSVFAGLENAHYILKMETLCFLKYLGVWTSLYVELIIRKTATWAFYGQFHDICTIAELIGLTCGMACVSQSEVFIRFVDCRRAAKITKFMHWFRALEDWWYCIIAKLTFSGGEVSTTWFYEIYRTSVYIKMA